MERIIHYKIEDKVANPVRKVLAKISDVDLRSNFGLSDEEVLCIHTYLDTVESDY